MKNVRQSMGTRACQRSRNDSLVRGAIKNRHYRGKETTRGRALEMPKQMRRAIKQADKARALAASVGRCRRGHRCLSPACPLCAQAAQALLTSITKKFVREHENECRIAFVTVIPRNSLVRKGVLHAFNLANFKRRVRDGLSKPSAVWAIGSVDFSLNERQYGARELNWLPHVHLIVATYDIDELARDLRAAFPRSDHAPRPVMVKNGTAMRGSLHTYSRQISAGGFPSRRRNVLTKRRGRTAHAGERHPDAFASRNASSWPCISTPLGSTGACCFATRASTGSKSRSESS
jgi:hypothetical protein